VEVEVVQKSTGVLGFDLYSDTTPYIKVVSNQGDGGRDERINARQSPLHSSISALALPGSSVSSDDTMFTKTVRPLLTS
jgi:hypothetical protein